MKIPFWATFFTLCGICILYGLGIWQLQRLEWKAGLIAKVEAEDLLDAAQVPLTEIDFQQHSFKRGFVEGTFLPEKAFLIGPRTHDGVPGYHLIVPFLEEGKRQAILVNRGWVPLDKATDANSPNEKIKLLGMIRDPQEPNIFTPINEPERDIWYRYDMAQIAKAKNLANLAAKIFYEEREVAPDAYPIPTKNKNLLRNNHAQYALFWFSMAGLLGLIYMLRFILKR